MAKLPKHSVSVAAIVFDSDGRVLLIQRRDNQHWEPPGGVLELGETPEEGVQREVREETGIEVRVRSLSGVYKNMTKAVVALVFSCEVEAGAPHETDEARRVQWFEVEKALLMMSESFAVRVLDATRGGVHVRSHDGIRFLS